MYRHVSLEHSDLSTALSLVNYRAERETALATVRQLTRASRVLSTSCDVEGINFPAHQIAAVSAAVLEKLAARFRRAERALKAR